MAASPLNAVALERIESAIFVIALDDTKPVTREDISWQCWVGNGRNRFYDKHQRVYSFSCSISLLYFIIVIVFDNGRSGFLGEHSCMDGTPTLRLNVKMVNITLHIMLIISL